MYAALSGTSTYSSLLRALVDQTTVGPSIYSHTVNWPLAVRPSRGGLPGLDRPMGLLDGKPEARVSSGDVAGGIVSSLRIYLMCNIL